MLNARIKDQLALLPDFLAHHLALSLTALTIGILISVPMGILASRKKRLGGALLGIAGVIQTVPSLALLALMVPLLGMIGFWPALVALVLYSMLPILRSTVTGLQGIDAGMTEAAEAVGMTPWQCLRRVELPLAAPNIIGGIRTACVWVVGIATLATPVGQTTLGNFIFTGLQTQNHAAVIVGCLGAAALAITLDLIIRTFEVASRERRPRLTAVAGIALAAAVAVGVVPLVSSARARDPQTILVGAKTFTEQYVLAEMLSEKMRSSGFRVATKAGLGSQIAFDALANNSIDCYVDYSGTIWTNVMHRSDFPSRRQMLVDIKRFLNTKYGIVSMGRLGFENTYALAMPRKLAEQLGITTISDLVANARTLRLGGDVEFFGRPEWERVQAVYGLDFAKTVSMDSTLMYAAVVKGEVDVISAFSSDGRIAASDLIVLQDDRSAFPPYDAIVLLSQRAARNPNLFASLSPILESIDDNTMRMTNKLVDVDRLSPSQAATVLLRAMAETKDGDSPATYLLTAGAVPGKGPVIEASNTKSVPKQPVPIDRESAEHVQ